MRYRKSLALLGSLSLFLMLCGCTTDASIQDGKGINPQQGLLVMKVIADQDYLLDYVPYTAAGRGLYEQTLTSGATLKIEKGVRYWVVPLPAGEYMLSDVYTVHPRQITNMAGENRFVIQPGKINYIGDFLMVSLQGNKFGVWAADGEVKARRYLEANYPVDMRSLAFEKHIAHMHAK